METTLNFTSEGQILDGVSFWVILGSPFNVLRLFPCLAPGTWHLAYIIHRITVNIKLELVSKRVLVIVKCYCKCELVYYSLTQKEITYIQSAKYVLSAELLTL